MPDPTIDIEYHNEIDARRYRALRDCPRIRVMGYAGNIRPGDTSSNKPGHIHAGWEFWSYDPYPEQPGHTPDDMRELFDTFADKMVEAADGKA